MKKNNGWQALTALLLASVFASCSDSDDWGGGSGPGTNAPEGSAGGYVIAASSREATYLLQTDRLDEGDLTIVNTGLEVEAATAWVFYKNKYLYRLQYNQGNAGLGSSYRLNAAGKLEPRNIGFEVQNRFTTYGCYGDYVLMAASGVTAQSGGKENLPMYGVTFTVIDAEAQTLTTRTVVTENLTGNGEYFTISGVVERDGKFYTALCPQGLSPYGVSEGYAVDESLIEEGAISATQYPDSVWVAIYDGLDFDRPKILRDDRISYATSRYRSQFYSTVVPDDEGNIYVFSSSYAKGQTGIQKTSRPSGVIRIAAGEEAFDPDYYCNIEEVADGRRVFQVWHITGDYFLLRMYADASDHSGATADTRRLAVFKAGEKKFQWVEGMPQREVIGSIGRFPCMENGLAYVPVVTTDGNQPAVYVVDPATATASRGVTVTSSEITAVGKLTNEH